MRVKLLSTEKRETLLLAYVHMSKRREIVVGFVMSKIVTRLLK